MFDKYIISEQGFANRSEGGRVVGFSFGARLPYYRGLGLSMVEELALVVDGEPVPREAMHFRLGDRRWSLAQMETEYEAVWEMGQVATIEVDRPGGLAAGPHRLELMVQMRVSYMPVPSRGSDAKSLVLAA